MTEQYIPGFKLPAQLEQVGDDDPEGVQNRIHRSHDVPVLTQHANPETDVIFRKDTKVLFPTMLTKISAAFALIAASSQTALATDWQCCLAPSQAEHKIYMSGAFPVRGALYDADSAFELMLDQAGLRVTMSCNVRAPMTNARSR
jgi:hypothetical protein